MKLKVVLAVSIFVVIAGLSFAGGPISSQKDLVKQGLKTDALNKTVELNKTAPSDQSVSFTVDSIYNMRINIFSDHQATLFIQAKNSGAHYGYDFEKVIALKNLLEEAKKSCPNATISFDNGIDRFNNNTIFYQNFHIATNTEDGSYACDIN